MEVPITKKQFVEAINDIQRYWDNLLKVEAILEVNFEGGPMIDLLYSYLETLCELMKDDPDNDYDTPWILHFCWERDFGRDSSSPVEYDEEEFPLETAEDLYDLLIKIYWEEKEN